MVLRAFWMCFKKNPMLVYSPNSVNKEIIAGQTTQDYSNQSEIGSVFQLITGLGKAVGGC